MANLTCSRPTLDPALTRFRPGLADVSHGTNGKWWTGLDSNQRTLARADLQSAAFNHSATCPHSPLTGRGAFPERCDALKMRESVFGPAAERRPFGEAVLACQWPCWQRARLKA